jgi:hypothetical protein
VNTLKRYRKYIFLYLEKEFEKKATSIWMISYVYLFYETKI